MTWKKRGQRSYEKQPKDGKYQAFVFAASGEYLWAWAVYWDRGAASGVEHSFVRAKSRAGECIDTVVNPKPWPGEKEPNA